MPHTTLPVTAYQQNCSIVWCEATRQAALIDPGGEAERLLDAVGALGVTPQMLLLTHGHLDHVGAALEISRQLAIPILGPQREDAFWLDSLPEQARQFGFPPTERLTPDRWLEDGEVIEVGSLSLEVIHCPGHTPGHVVFFNRTEKIAFVGDVLFAGSIGRSDFPRGDQAQLIGCIRDKLFVLGDDIRFVPGHGPDSSFGRERKSNPYVGERA